VWSFAAAAGCVAVSFLFRVAIGHPSLDEYPGWLPTVQVILAGGWLLAACGGCALRLRGYLLCRTAADRYALGGWVVTAAFGAALSAIGVLAVAPLIIGRPILVLPPTAAGFLLIGLSAGLVGVLLEFAFLAVVNRLLWETAGWQAATHTGRYAIAVVFGMVAVMGCLCLGVVALVLTAGGADANTDTANAPLVAKVIAVLVILAVSGISGWLTWRFARLLQLTREAVCQPEPTPDPPVPSGG